MDVSIVVLNYNTREHLRECLQSLYAERSTSIGRGSLEAEVIVVDNASSDGSADMVAAEFPSLTLIRSPRNGGYAYGNNQALARVRGEFVLLLNPDARLSAGAIRGLVQTLRDHPEAGI